MPRVLCEIKAASVGERSTQISAPNTRNLTPDTFYRSLETRLVGNPQRGDGNIEKDLTSLPYGQCCSPGRSDNFRRYIIFSGNPFCIRKKISGDRNQDARRVF